jgi:RNA polymerase sigma-70 factor, ECF subfamily
MTEPFAHGLRAVAVVTDAAGTVDPGAAVDQSPDADEIIARLYRDNGAFVLGYVTGLLKDRYLAEDVVQETMLRAWLHCAHFSAERGSVRGWLIRVAHNIAMDKLRMRRSRPPEVAETCMQDIVAADHADAVVTGLFVRDVLALLSPLHREVLELVYLGDCTAREAAARLGIPQGTAFSRVHYALSALRAELGVASDGRVAA